MAAAVSRLVIMIGRRRGALLHTMRSRKTHMHVGMQGLMGRCPHVYIYIYIYMASELHASVFLWAFQCLKCEFDFGVCTVYATIVAVT